MEIREKLFECIIMSLEEITGVPKEELEENPDLNLKEVDLLDSISCASLIALTENKLNKNLDIDKIDTKLMTSINSIVECFVAALI